VFRGQKLDHLRESVPTAPSPQVLP